MERRELTQPRDAGVPSTDLYLPGWWWFGGGGWGQMGGRGDDTQDPLREISVTPAFIVVTENEVGTSLGEGGKDTQV